MSRLRRHACRVVAPAPLRCCLWLAALAVLLSGCAGHDRTDSHGHFQPGPRGHGPVPWNHDNFDADAGTFTFAIFADLTGGEREGVFSVAAQQLSLLRPELIINVGDLVEGETTDRQQLIAQWEHFDQRAGLARAPVFYVGGNHDLNTQLLREVWEERYGRRYYHFVYRDTLFLVLDTEDHAPERMREISAARDQALARVRSEGNWSSFNSSAYARMPENKAGTISAAQSEYIRTALTEHPDVRWTFLFMHKAPWLRADGPHFAAIEEALAGRPYTVFHGHEHIYQHRQRHGRDYIQLATTGGVQFGDLGLSADMLTLVTLGQGEPAIVNLRLDGILDKHGQLPGNGAQLCFEAARCAQQ